MKLVHPLDQSPSQMLVTPCPSAFTLTIFAAPADFLYSSTNTLLPRAIGTSDVQPSLQSERHTLLKGSTASSSTSPMIPIVTSRLYVWDLTLHNASYSSPRPMSVP